MGGGNGTAAPTPPATVGQLGHLYSGSGQHGYYIGLAVYIAVWLVGAGLFWRYRKYQPVRARDTNMTLVTSFLPLPTLITFAIRAETGDFVGTCWGSWVMANLLGPLYVVPFELSALGLIYIYEWNLEKLKKADGFWFKHAHVFFATWFRVAVILGFIIAQIALSAIVQNNRFAEGGSSCVLMSPIALAPFYVVYVLVFIYILYKLYGVDDIFEMKRGYLAIFVVAPTVIGGWLVTTSLQNYGKLSDSFFTPSLVLVAAGISNIILLYYPILLLFREPWRSMRARYSKGSKSMNDTDDLEGSPIALVSLNLSSSLSDPSLPDAVGDEKSAFDALNVNPQLLDVKAMDASHTPLKAYLMDPLYAESFKKHCVKSLCVESALFYLDARDAIFDAALRTSTELREAVNKLMTLYIRVGAVLEINISDQVRKAIIREYEANAKDDPRIMRLAISEVYWVLKNNVFASWLDSRDFNRVRLFHASPVELNRRRALATAVAPSSAAEVVVNSDDDAQVSPV